MRQIAMRAKPPRVLLDRWIIFEKGHVLCLVRTPGDGAPGEGEGAGGGAEPWAGVWRDEVIGERTSNNQ